ncbi:MAG: hypothetical protein P1U56_20925 [Saprospiraceae bacterium]|nr:hypothetical protein [Saprospiraceae bacterium]
MIRTIILALLLFNQLHAKADYAPMALHELIIKSDKIVYGEIVELSSEHFKFKVKGSLTGDKGVLKIRRFMDWTCASRWTKYETGQKLLLFLFSNNDKLHIMGAGDEGELPISDNSVYVHGLSLGYVNGDQNDILNSDFTFPIEQYNLYGADYFGNKFELNEFLESAAFIRQCFNLEKGEYFGMFDWEFSCDFQVIKAKAKKSLIITAILREAIERENE